METIVKIDVRKMKEDIKKMVEEQKFYKRMRKDAKFVGSVNGQGHWDPFPPSQAQWKHAAQRKRLRVMYAAYGQARGKSFSQIEKHYENHNPHPLEQYKDQINGILEKYKIEVPVEVQSQE